MFRTQKDEIRKGIQNNAGFTLIEMIVTVAIIAIFSGVVVTLIGTGSNLFRDVSGNTKSQIDAQETLNAIEDLIIDANRSVYYAYGSGTAMGEQIRSDIDDSNAASKTFITCNEYENGDGTSRYVFDVLDWVGSEGKLYYSQRQYTKASSSAEEKDENGSGENPESQQNKNGSGASGANVENIDIAVAAEGDEENQTGTISGNSSDIARDSKELIARSVFAEGIENFTADVTKVESERIVRFRLTTENNGKKVKTLHTVNLRNRIQVLKPDDAFATAGSTDIRITIVGAPSSIDAGNSKILSYDASGPIDPTTVVWKITDGADKGSFPALDPTYGKLTVNNNATGTITVIVSAKTADGKQTATSAPVTIQINNNRIVTGIETETKSVLVAAGYDGLNLNSEIIWKYVYSDGTKGEDNVPVIWTMDNADNCSYASVTSEGQISVKSESGTSDKGSFTVRATNGEHNVSNTITVKIARIDLLLPENNATCTIGTPKELHCTYMEGGQVVETIDGNNASDIVNITTKQKPEKASDYSVGGNFAENDIGNWEVKASADVSVRGGYGTLSVTNTFSVSGYTAQIVLGKNKSLDTIVIKNNQNTGEYICQVNSGEGGFSFVTNKTIPGFWENSRINWYLKSGHNYSGINVTPTENGNKNASVSVSADAKTGFILCADYIKYTDQTQTTEQIKIHAEKAIKVATGIEIVSAHGDTVKVRDNYEFGINMIVYDSNGTQAKIPVRSDICNDSNIVTITPDPWAEKHPCADGENWYFQTSEPGTQKVTVELYKIPGATVFNSNYGFKQEKSVEVIDTTTAHVVAVNNKTSIFPGESTQIYLELLRDGQPITDKIDENWTCETINGQTIGNLSPTYYEYAYANEKENLITVTANSQITRATTYTITVSYKLYNNEPLRTASIDITVTPLTMNLTTSATQIHYGQDSITITADVVDAEHDQHVTDDYNIEWTLNPEEAAIYSLDNLSGKITHLSLNQAPDASRIVTVTATARDKTSGAAICTSSTKITVSPKTTIEKSYNCASGKTQKLEFNDEDVNKSSGTIKTSYLTATGSVPVECARNNIPFLTLNGTNPSNLSITMKEDTSNYENYKYVLISVDLGDVLYNFYIYPLQYNVYDCVYGQDAVPFTYVPTDLESIRKLAKLGSEDKADNGYPGYTYTYTDALGESCYLRLSVYSKTGIGSFSGNYVESSSGKWFMKRKTKNKDQNDGSDQAYYRLYGNKWYKFHSKNSVKSENYATTALYNQAKAERTRYYWDLKDNVHLYDDSGNEIGGEKGIQNTYFWQKWK